MLLVISVDKNSQDKWWSKSTILSFPYTSDLAPLLSLQQLYTIIFTLTASLKQM